MTPAERAMAGRLGAYKSWGNTPDRAKRTAPARRAADAKFERLAREKHPGISGVELAQCAEAMRKAYYAELALKSVRARKKAAGK